MSLSDLASIGNFVSGIAVVFSFIFLAMQLRQANLNQRSLMQQGRASRTMQMLERISEPEVAKVMARADRHDVDLEAWEVYVLRGTHGSYFAHFEDTYLQFKAGTLDAVSWSSEVAILTGVTHLPQYRAVWRVVKSLYSEGYRAFVDQLMDAAKDRYDEDSGKVWKTFIAEERRVPASRDLRP
jgi:hypothetical protein